MPERIKPTGSSVLERWSRLKREARENEKSSPVASTASPTAGDDPAARAVPAPVTPPTRQPVNPADTAARASSVGGQDTLPPVESLTIDSDFSAFLQPKVDEALKRQALKQLFRDPHFNVMDGLDIYVGDYSQPDPLSPDIVREMVQGRYIFDPPPTRINAQGFVEDVPADEVAALKAAATPPSADAASHPEPSAGPPPLPTAPSAPEESAAVPTAAIAEEPGIGAPPPDASDPPGGAAR